MSTTYSARTIFPVAGAPLERGTITIVGDKIESVNPHGERTPDVDLGNAAIIPGLVNAHTHLDLTGAKGKIPPTDPEHFCDWLRNVIEYRQSQTTKETINDIRAGFEDCLRYGTTLVGDITSRGLSYSQLANAPIRAELHWELIGLKESTLGDNWNAMCHFTGLSESENPVAPVWKPTATCRWYSSPHSPYSLIPDFAIAQMAYSGGVMHLAESPGELELLNDRTGPFVDFLMRLNLWDESLFAYLRMEDYVQRMETGNMHLRRLYIHCNYLPVYQFPESVSIVYCPRTHAAFRHPRHPFAEFLARGVNVALGTDSLASNPDLDLLAEAKHVFDHRKDVTGETILKMATLNGAKALGWADESGSLEAGKSADFVVVPLANLDSRDPHEVLFTDISMPRRTLFRGQLRTV